MRKFLLVPIVAVLLAACGGPGPLQAIAPQVLETYPAAGAVDVPISTSLWARFDAAVDQVWLAGHFVLTDGANGPITVSVAYDADTHTATFTPSAPLVHGATYEAAFHAGTTTTSAAGVLAEDVSWSFVTVSDAAEEGEEVPTGEEGEEVPTGEEGEEVPTGEEGEEGEGAEEGPCDADGNCSYSGTTFDTLEVPAGATYILTDVTVGNLIVGPGATVIGVNLIVNGSVTIDGAAHVGFDNVWIKGNLSIYNGGSVDIRNSLIRDDLDLRYNTGFIYLEGNRIGDDLTLRYNTGGATLIDNDVDDDLTCSDNTPAPTGHGNTADDAEGQCSTIADDD